MIGFFQLQLPKIVEKTYSNCKNKSYAERDLNFPFIEIKSKIFGKKIISLPFLDVTNFKGKATKHIFKKMVDRLGKENKIEIKLSENHTQFKEIKKILSEMGFDEFSEKAHIVTKLTPEEDMWKRFHKHTRNDIRKAEKPSLKIKKIESVKELKKFYLLYLRQMKGFGTPQHSFKFFENYFNIMKRNFFGLNCYKGGKLIASIILFLGNREAYVSFNVSNPQYRSYRPNDLLYLAVIKECIKKKIKYFDIGQIDLNTKKGTREDSLLKFKLKWLGESHKKVHFTLNFKHDSNKKDSLKKFRKIWKKLPLFVVKLVGPKIVRELG